MFSDNPSYPIGAGFSLVSATSANFANHGLNAKGELSDGGSRGKMEEEEEAGEEEEAEEVEAEEVEKAEEKGGAPRGTWQHEVNAAEENDGPTPAEGTPDSPTERSRPPVSVESALGPKEQAEISQERSMSSDVPAVQLALAISNKGKFTHAEEAPFADADQQRQQQHEKQDLDLGGSVPGSVPAGIGGGGGDDDRTEAASTTSQTRKPSVRVRSKESKRSARPRRSSAVGAKARGEGDGRGKQQHDDSRVASKRRVEKIENNSTAGAAGAAAGAAINKNVTVESEALPNGISREGHHGDRHGSSTSLHHREHRTHHHHHKEHKVTRCCVSVFKNTTTPPCEVVVDAISIYRVCALVCLDRKMRSVPLSILWSGIL